MSAATGTRRGLQSILTTQLLIIAAVVIVANVIFVAVFDASDRRSLIIDLIQRELLRLEAAWLDSGRQADAMVRSETGIYAAHPEAYAFVVLGPDGTVLNGRNAGLIPPELLRPGAFAADWVAWPEGAQAMTVVGSHSVRGSELPVSIVFLMAADPADLLGAEVQDEFRGHVWLPLLPIAVLLIGGTLLIIRRALRPVSQAAGWARAIRPGQALPPLDLARAPAEVDDLTQAVRRSIERLDAELVAEQRRAAEAAHALRTPVAVLVARLDELPSTPDYDSLREDVRALSRMVTQFLSSAGADRLEVAEESRADLSAIAARVVAEMFPLAEAMGCEISLSGNESPTWVIGASDAIALALTNLVENALYHGGPGAIDVTVGPGPHLSVRDHGPGLPEAGRAGLFEPFQRGAGALRGGAGLGLAIVARIQRAHGGSVEVRDAEGGGAVFRLDFRSA